MRLLMCSGGVRLYIYFLNEMAASEQWGKISAASVFCFSSLIVLSSNRASAAQCIETTRSPDSCPPRCPLSSSPWPYRDLFCSQIGSMAEIVYPQGCRPITDDLGPDELVRRLKVCFEALILNSIF